MRAFKDDRNRAYNDVFPAIETGDTNVSVLYSNAIKAWHKHQNQTDYWMCVKGNLKVGLVATDDGCPEFVYLSEGDSLVIPPGTWHGVHNISDKESILLYHIAPKYDENSPDELRVPWDKWGKWEVSKK